MSNQALQLGFNIGQSIGEAQYGADDRKLAREQARANIDSQVLSNQVKEQQIQQNAITLQQLQQQVDDIQAQRLIYEFNSAGAMIAQIGDATQLENLLNDPQKRQMLAKYNGLDPFEGIDILPIDGYDTEKTASFIQDVATMRAMNQYAAVGQNLPPDYQPTPEELETASKSVRLAYDTANKRTQLIDLNTISQFLFPNGYYQGQYQLTQQQKRIDAIKAVLEARKTVSDINNTDQDTINKHDENNRANVSLPGNMAKTQSETNKNNADATTTLNKTNIENNEAKMRAFAHQQSFNQHGDNPTAKVDSVDGVPVWNPQTGKNGGPNEEMLKHDIQTNLNRIGLNLSNMVDTNGNIPYTPQQSLALSRDLSNVLAQINMLPEEYRKSLDNQSNADVIASVASRVNPTDKEHIRTQYNQVMGHTSPDNFGMTISEIENVNNEVAKFNSENTSAGNIRASGVMEIWQDIGQFFGANGTTINNEKLRDLLRRMPATLVRNTSDGRDSNMSQKAFGIDNGVFAKTSDTQKVHNLVQNTKTLIKNAYMSSTSPLDKAVLEQLAQNSEKNLVVLEIAVNADKKYLTRNIKEIKSTNIDDIKRAAESSSVYKVMSDGSVYFYPQQTRISERGLPLGIKFNSLDEFNKQKAKWQ